MIKVNWPASIADTSRISLIRFKTQSIAAGREILIETKLDAIPMILGHGAELREVLTNLIFNAVDAMPAGGTIVLRTCVDGEDVLLQVSDTNPA